MDEELKGLLDSLKDSHKTNVKGREKALGAEDEWVAKFDALRRKVIRPQDRGIPARQGGRRPRAGQVHRAVQAAIEPAGDQGVMDRSGRTR
jgi:hypothetical protein